MEEEKENMECRNFYLTITSAVNLPNVLREDEETRAYAKIFVGSAEKNAEDRTPTDRDSGLNPAWNHGLRYQIADTGVQYYGVSVVIKLYCNRLLKKDRYIGEFHAPMKDLYDQALKQGGNATLARPIRQGATETTGILKFSYSFGDKFTVRKRDFRESVTKGLGAWIMTNVGSEVAAEVAGQVASQVVGVLFVVLPVALAL